ncbi:MAG: hypothetical protein KJN92_05235, partial [Gemmatimonadetes bacterium]|nr:hypothetical protein [Gemmatimonadota bacterium]
MSLKRALLSLVVLVLAVGTVPAGIIAHGFLGRALNERVRESLAMAPELLGARWQATVDVRMMHARDVARTPGLAEALMQGEESQAARMVEQAGAGFPEAPLLLGSSGESLIPAEEVPEPLLEATRRGEMPVAVVPTPGQVRVVSLAPVEMEGAWIGAAGGTSVLDEAEAAMLAGLTRSQVLILDNQGGVVAASSPLEEAEALARSLVAALSGPDSEGPPVSAARGDSESEAGDEPGARDAHGSIQEVRVDNGRYLLLAAPFG